MHSLHTHTHTHTHTHYCTQDDKQNCQQNVTMSQCRTTKNITMTTRIETAISQQ